MTSLPLFPLGTVLLPGARLPLQLFEPRYVELLRDLLEGQEERSPVFGVVAIREGWEVGDDAVRALHPVGCGALVTQVAALEDGRFLVVSEGTRRFRLDAVDVDAGTAYTTADVTWLDEPTGDEVAVVELAARLRAALLAYSVPRTVALDLADRQRVLECVDTESRLRLALQLVRREKELLTTLGAVAEPPAPPTNLN